MKIVIIGNGITGVTAARHIRKLSDHEIVVVSSETEHFFSRTALMYIYMGHLRYQDTKPYEDGFWKKNRIQLKHCHIQKVDFQNKKLIADSGENIPYDRLILATGSLPNFFGWPGQELNGVQGLYSYQDLENMEANTQNVKEAIVVGGGLIGVEMAEMLHSRNIKVHFLVREKSFWSQVLPPEESEMVNRHILEHGIDLQLETEIESINDDGNGRAASVKTTDGRTISGNFVGITVGVHPNIEFLKDTNLETDKGIVVNEFLETNIEDVYAAGDCAQFKEAFPGRKPIEQVWYTGRIQAEALARTICSHRTPYEPGVWFNSAKFFDIEYQVYGTVPSKIEAPYDSLFWKSNDDKKAIRIVFEQGSKKVRGFNLMGVRYRQNICTKWIEEEALLEEILPRLKVANFDPEFHKTHEEDLIQQYNEKFPGQEIKSKRKRGIKGIMEIFGIN